MAAEQTIAIIGATGNMGSAISKSIAKGNYRLLLMGKDDSKLSALKIEIIQINSQISIDLITCAKNASWEADIIMLAVPYAVELEVAEKIKEVATGKIVVSISNRFPKEWQGLSTASNYSAAEELQNSLPNSKVVKAFSTNFSTQFMQPVYDGIQVNSFLAGNDIEAVKSVEQIIKLSGFKPIIRGNLSTCHSLKGMQDWIDKVEDFI